MDDLGADMSEDQPSTRCYASQIPPFPGARSVEAIRAPAQFRGTQAGFGFGEAFYIIRMTR